MKFLIVGASGFVGRNLLAFYREQGFEAIGTQAHAREQGLVNFDLLRDRIGNSIDKTFFHGTEPVQAVIAAVVSDMDLCLTNRSLAHAVNVENTIQLINDLAERNARVTFLSTCFVFDGKKGYYNETNSCFPANEYGRHKLEVETYLRRRLPSAFIPRMDKIVGDNPHDRQLLAHWHQRIRDHQPIVCLEGSLLSPTFVLDVARGILLASQMKLSGVYHVSNSEFFYRDELARQFCYALGVSPNVITKPLAEFRFADKRALNSYLDGSRFAKDTSLRFTSMREVFNRFIHRLPGASPN